MGRDARLRETELLAIAACYAMDSSIVKGAEKDTGRNIDVRRIVDFIADGLPKDMKIDSLQRSCAARRALEIIHGE